MNLRVPKNIFNSIRFKLMIGVFIFLVPFLLVLLYNNFYAVNVVRDQVAKANLNVVDLYLKHIDGNLVQMDQYLADLAAADTNISLIETSKDENGYVLAIVKLKNTISEDILINRTMDAIFVYNESKNLFMYAKNAPGTDLDFEYSNTELIHAIKTSTENGFDFSDGWRAIKSDGSYCLLRIMKIGGTYVGAWVRTERLQVPQTDNNLRLNSKSIFATEQGEAMNDVAFVQLNELDLKHDYQNYYLTGNKDQYIIVGKKSSVGNFNMLAIIPDSNIILDAPYIRSILMLTAMATMVLIPVYLIVIRKTVLNPIKRITLVMKKIRKGDLDLRIEPFKTSEEFQLLNDTFNDMLDKVNRLKIDIYEEKISRQREELKHLQLQVKPHFFLNTLNIMNSLARVKNYELLQEMSMCLIQYFRYMFRSNTEFVALKDELFHVKNYIRIQELRFPESLSSEMMIPDFLMGTPVPPLIVHTFVENTVKHSVTLDEPIHLSISASVDESENRNGIRIVIKDNGKGFSETVLSKLAKDERIIDEEGEHIGIRNIRKQLAILYSGMAEFVCRNDKAGGAVVEMYLPFDAMQT